MKQAMIFSFLVLTILPFSCNQDDVKIYSAKLDKVMIPIYHDLYNGDLDNAYFPTLLLARKWQMHKEYIQTLEDYTDEFGTMPSFVENKIQELVSEIQGEHQKEALYTFIQIQNTLADWRVNQGADYYLDDWYEFKFDVDIFEDVVGDQLLDLCEWEEVEWHYEYISTSFYFLNTEIYDLEYFDIDRNIFDDRLLGVSKALMTLDRAMENAQRDEVVCATENLQIKIMDAFGLFGDYEGAYTAVAIE